MNPKREQAVSCGSCGLDASVGAKFCSECGNELFPTPSFCGECGSPLANNAKFCGSCGVAVGVAPEQANLEPENAGREIVEWLTPIIGEVVDESLKSVQIFAGPTPEPACTVSFSLGVVDLRLDTTQVDLALLIDPDTWEDVTEVDDQEPEKLRHFYLEPDDFDELGFELIEDLAAQLDSESWRVVRITADGMTEEEMFEVSAVEDVLNSAKYGKMPATTLHNKARILADFALGYFDEPELSDFISRHAETFATCQGYVRGEIETIEGNTRDQIESLFTKFLAEVEAEDGEYEDIEDVFVAHYDGDELIGLYKHRG